MGEVEKEQLGYFVGKSKAFAEHPTDEAKSVSKIVMIQMFISNHEVVIVILGKSDYEFVAIAKPFLISSKLTDIVIVLGCRK